MNAMILRQSIDFQQFMSRVKDIGSDTAEQIKSESEAIKIGRLQGRLTTIDDIIGLLDQIESEPETEN